MLPPWLREAVSNRSILLNEEQADCLILETTRQGIFMLCRILVRSNIE